MPRLTRDGRPVPPQAKRLTIQTATVRVVDRSTRSRHDKRERLMPQGRPYDIFGDAEVSLAQISMREPRL